MNAVTPTFLSPEHLALIMGLALITLLFRLGGYWGGAWLSRFPLASRLLAVFPRLILAALVARSLSHGAPALWGVAAVCLVVALTVRNVACVMLVGIGLVLGLSWMGVDGL